MGDQDPSNALAERLAALGRCMTAHFGWPAQERLQLARIRVRAVEPNTPIETFEAYARDLVLRCEALSVVGALESMGEALIVGLPVDVILSTTPTVWAAYDRFYRIGAIERLRI